MSNSCLVIYRFLWCIFQCNFPVFPVDKRQKCVILNLLSVLTSRVMPFLLSLLTIFPALWLALLTFIFPAKVSIANAFTVK